MKGLADRVYLVAGAGRGIGAAVATRLAREGAKVVLGDLDLATVRDTAAKIQADGGTAHAVHYDQSDEDSVARLVLQTVEHFGVLHGLHANAADISAPTMAADLDLLRMTPEAWTRVLRVNLIGYALLIRETLPHLLGNDTGGAIVCTTSDADDLGQRSLPAYAASKAGIDTLVRHTASRWGKQNIRANAVAPGLVQTETAQELSSSAHVEKSLAAVRSPRLGVPDDIASTVAFLLSDEACWVNGQVWSVNGGMLMRG
ncbi:MAG: SDR family oxidoreductase [Acidimicrobiales bacterium]|nr:SDR family oxidoreductase [Acidimicrobiales bacterium]